MSAQQELGAGSAEQAAQAALDGLFRGGMAAQRAWALAFSLQESQRRELLDCIADVRAEIIAARLMLGAVITEGRKS